MIWSRATGADAMTKKTLHDWDLRTRLRSVPGVQRDQLVAAYPAVSRRGRPKQLDRYGPDGSNQVVQGRLPTTTRVRRRVHRARSESYTVPRHRAWSAASRISEHRRGGDPAARRSSCGTWPRSCRPDAESGAGHARTAAGRASAGHGDHAEGRRMASGWAEGGESADGRHQQSLPAGLSLKPFYDQTEVIDRTAHTVRKNCWRAPVGHDRALRLPRRHHRVAARGRRDPGPRCLSASSACGVRRVRPT